MLDPHPFTHESLRLLAGASELLANCMDYDATIEQFARLVVSSFADWCAIDLVTDDGRIERVAVAHRDPAKAELARQIQLRYAAKPTAKRGVYRVIGTRKSILIPEVADSAWAERADDPTHLELLLGLGSKSYMCVPLIARGNVVGSVMILSGARTYGEADLETAEELARRFALAVDNVRMFRKMREAIRIRDEFLSIAAHELRTPLTPLNVQADVLQSILDKERLEPQDLENIRKLLWISDAQIKRLCKLVNELLDVSRIESRQLDLERGEVDLSELVRDIIARFSSQLEDAGCRTELVEQEGLECRGPWDCARLDQVVSNLIANAVKYGPGKPIRVELSGDGDRVLLKVKDQGVGLSRGDQKRIFERYARVGSKPKAEGLGLGLYIAREIVDAHGGTLFVESEPGAGAAFTVELPRS